jgi:serine/threonine protein kinase
MITGHVPFSNFDEGNILSQHLQERVSPPSHSRSDVPMGLESIVMRLLEKNPGDRFPSAQEVRSALENTDLTPEAVRRGNLPPTDAAGRESEIAQIIHLLESNQLVTLLDDDETLALATGAQLTDQFTDGAWLVQLESVGEPQMVPHAVASMFGVHENPHRPLLLLLIESLREKKLLLLLNHCTHLTSACGQLAETIIRACPEVYILATSRLPLNVAAEKCFRGVDGTPSSGE